MSYATILAVLFLGPMMTMPPGIVIIEMRGQKKYRGIREKDSSLVKRNNYNTSPPLIIALLSFIVYLDNMDVKMIHVSARFLHVLIGVN